MALDTDGIPLLYGKFSKYYEQFEAQYKPSPKLDCDWIAHLVEKYGTKDLIDVACGPGYHIVDLACRKYGHAIKFAANDYSLDMLKLLREKAAGAFFSSHNDVSISNLDFLKLGELHPAAYDMAICMFSSFVYLDDEGMSKFFKSIYDTLKPRGHFIFSVENAEGMKDEIFGSKLGEPHIDGFVRDGDKLITRVCVSYPNSERNEVTWHSMYLTETKEDSRRSVNDVDYDPASTDIDDEWLTIRFLTPDRIVSFLRQAGFGEVQLYSGPGESYYSNCQTIYVDTER